jgi:hypothetical protein
MLVVASIGANACFQRPDHRGIAVVSLVYLLERPEKFDERVVEVGGVLAVGSEPDFWGNYLLYLTSEHAAARDRFTAIYVAMDVANDDPALSSCLERFVRVRGQVWKRPDGSYGIREVTQIKPMPVGSEFDPPCWAGPAA